MPHETEHTDTATAECYICQLEGYLREIYFWLGPPQPTVDFNGVPDLVAAVVAERDRLRTGHLVATEAADAAAEAVGAMAAKLSATLAECSQLRQRVKAMRDDQFKPDARHALHWVMNCEEGCDKCRQLAREVLERYPVKLANDGVDPDA